MEILYIQRNGMEFELHGNPTPEEPEAYEYPGYPARFNLERVVYQGKDITDLLYMLEGGLELFERIAEDEWETEQGY